MSATILESLSLEKTGHFVRLAIGLVLGLVVTAGLFWMMQYLIATADRTLNESSAGHLLDFVRLKRDESIQRRQLKPEKPPQPKTPPPQPPTPKLEDLNPSAEKIFIAAVPVETDIEMSGGFSLGVGEGDYLPIVKVAPIYPARALPRGLEGYCVVEYTVTSLGTTKAPVDLLDQFTSSLCHRHTPQHCVYQGQRELPVAGGWAKIPRLHPGMGGEQPWA